ncbi:MAG: iron-sulfur cluster assembly scaffold protein [Methanophagales archaeon]|nr:iron-sulfur cluster assembly scaffold protein [Methanophagales archaeon]
MAGEENIKNLLKISGYSSTAIEYFLKKVNVGIIEEEDVIDWLGDIPKQKIHCVCLAKRTLKFALNEYKQE